MVTLRAVYALGFIYHNLLFIGLTDDNSQYLRLFKPDIIHWSMHYWLKFWDMR